MNKPLDHASTSINRRRFLRATGGAVAPQRAFRRAFRPRRGNNTIKLGMIGCGGRGTGATNQALTAIPNIQLVAVGELFRTSAQKAIDQSFGHALDEGRRAARAPVPRLRRLQESHRRATSGSVPRLRPTAR